MLTTPQRRHCRGLGEKCEYWCFYQLQTVEQLGLCCFTGYAAARAENPSLIFLMTYWCKSAGKVFYIVALQNCSLQHEVFSCQPEGEEKVASYSLINKYIATFISQCSYLIENTVSVFWVICQFAAVLLLFVCHSIHTRIKDKFMSPQCLYWHILHIPNPNPDYSQQIKVTIGFKGWAHKVLLRQ